MNRAERANAYHNSGYNCCQAVAAAFSDVTGLSEAQSLAIGGGFGGGLRCGEICGAVSGAVMVLCMTHPYTDCTDLERKQQIAHLTKEFHRRFKAEFGCERCLDLLQADISDTERFKAAKASGVMKKCPVLIAAAVEIVEQILREKTR